LPKQVFAVIHVQNQSQAYSNLRIAEDTGCDGAFLISHGEVAPDELWDIYFHLRRISRLTLGINQLGYPTSLCFSDAYARGRREGLRVPMIWADNYKLTHEGQSLPDVVRDYKQRVLRDPPLYFGGVAFKHQPEEHLTGPELAREAIQACGHVDVLTTSGIRTGTAPDIEKIRTMREAVGTRAKLAIASGITPENVGEFLPYADAFLVSTGISRDFYNLDPLKTHRLTRQTKQ